MRIERVVARAFGPFRDEELRLAPGMTVVSGPNEAGKSTWHAAVRLAITGLRRGKGPGTAAERQLAERHRPWDQPERWAVEARLRLADGRIVEISQDLAGKVDCRAVDVGLGRDVSHEILDGTPDASRWLGLSRDAFAATISVSQAQILAVTDAADELQEQMQRAAATHGTDATAAEAITRLEQFRRDAVGIDRVGARGPLRSAKDRLAALEAQLVEVRRQHDEYLDRSADVDAAERRVETARQALLRAEAELALGRSRDSRARFESAAQLAARHPAAPEALSARDERADEVAGALDAWAGRPEPVALSGTSSEELERELAVLPGPPVGDVEPHPSVRDALRALDLAENAISLLEAEHSPVEEAALPRVDELRIREFARRLRVPQLPAAARLEEELHAARAAAEGARRPTSGPMVAGAVALAVAAWLAIIGQIAGAVAMLAVGVGAGAWAWRSGAATRAAAARVARAEAAIGPYREAVATAEADRSGAESEARDLGLPTDPAALDVLADRLASAAAIRRAGEERIARAARLAERREAAARALVAALMARGEEALDVDARGAWASYEAACRERAAQAAAAGTRAALTRELEARRAAERSAQATLEARRSAERRLRGAAASIGIEGEAPVDQLLAALRAWQHQRVERQRGNEAAIAEWQRLQSLLDGATLEDLERRAASDQGAAGHLLEQIGEPLPTPAGPLTAVEARVTRLREELLAETSHCDELRGNLQARRETLPDVAEAEESVTAARAERRRVEDLAATLDRTLGLLRSAEERVHRSLSPVLAASIGRWLPVVCQGAYVDVSVDPADLSVRVKEAASGKWREARLLSEGTREQIYLLLRVAMAEHLVTNGETAPLLLDEVTVQSDPGRKAQLLDVLHRLSSERQVVLFTHDDDVLSWAQRRLDSERDATVLLPSRHAASVVAAPAAQQHSGTVSAVSAGD